MHDSDNCHVTAFVLGFSLQVVMEGVVGTVLSGGSLAVDDISFTPGCQVGGTLQPSGPTVSTSTTQSPCSLGQRACSDGTCLAEEKFCDFEPDCTSDEQT